MLNFVSLDIETASSDARSICEIGLARFEKGELAETFQSTIRPDQYFELDFWNEGIHGLSAEEILKAPNIAEVWPEIRRFLDSSLMVAHGATNDFKKLLATLEASSADLPVGDFQYLCTEVATRNSKLIEPEDYRLDSLARYLGLTRRTDLKPRTSGIHSAIEDAILAGEVVLQLAKAEGADSVEALAKRLRLNLGQVTSGLVARGCTKSSNLRSSHMNASDFENLKEEVRESLFTIDNHPSQGKKFLLTLSLSGISEEEFNVAIAIIGGEIKSGVSSSLHYLIEGTDPSGKYKTGFTSKSLKARDLNSREKASIQILDENELLNLLGQEVVERAKEFLQIKVQSLKSPVQIKSEQRRKVYEKKTQVRLELGEKLLSEFLKDPKWQDPQISPTMRVCFTQILDSNEEESLGKFVVSQGGVITKHVNGKLNLLVIADGFEGSSAKLRNALIAGVPVTKLSIFKNAYPNWQK